MFRETKGFSYLELVEQENQEQLITPGDRISYSIYARDGYKLVDIVEGSSGRSASTTVSGATYLVRQDGYVELPILGLIYVQGYTRLQLEELLEDRYSVMYNDPFILLNVTNKNAYMFLGLDGARIVNLPDDNTTLLEVIALAGGIPSGAKSHNIRIIRGDFDNPSIKRVNLSTIDGLKDADMVIQPNDVIIIAPVTKFAPVILREITPVLSLISTTITIIVLIRNRGGL